MKIRRVTTVVKYFLLLFVSMLLNSANALDFLLPQSSEIYGFGSFLGQFDVTQGSYGRVPQSSIELGVSQPEIRAPASGAVEYIQYESPPFSSIFSFPLGNAIAIEHPEKYLSVIAGLDNLTSFTSEVSSQQNTKIIRISGGAKISGGAGSGIFKLNSFSVSLYDANNTLWINPIFLAPWIVDHSAPVIRDITLTRTGASNGTSFELVSPRGSKETNITCLQGNYSVAVNAYDSIASTTNLYSAPYRFAAVLDGKTILDTSFLGAKRSDNGLSFLDNPAPSWNAITLNGLLKVGSIVLPKGEHDLSVLISDYSGNTSVVKSRLIVY